MSDDERLQRLTELARRVWPDIDAAIVDHAQSAGVYARAQGETMVAMVLRHPLSLDALEAALRELAGEAPAWVDELASKWEREAAEDGSPPDQQDEGGTFVAVMLSVAAELRERAKTGR